MLLLSAFCLMLSATIPPGSLEQSTAFPNRARFGMNLCGVIDWSTELPFVDVFKASRPWIPKSKGDYQYDEHLNPLLKQGQAVETYAVREIGGHYPGGKYVCTYEGTGRIEIRRWDVTKTGPTRPGRLEFEVKPGDGGILISVLASSPTDPIRNIRIFMPGFEQSKSPWFPPFIERLEPFGVLRFLDWQRTNDSPLAAWGQRAKPTDARYSTDAGVPVEIMIELANARLANPWFCMPHLANDDFVRQFALLVKEKLNPQLKIYLEYSNEVWNNQFKQAKHARERGKALKLSTNDYQAQLRYCSQRSVEIFKIWESVFQGKDRLVRVLPAQSANPWTSEQVLTWRDAYKHADALAIAPYFGNSFGDPKNVSSTLQMTVDKLLDKLEEEIDGGNRELIRRQAELAKKHGLRLVAYEGGQHLVGFGGTETRAELTELLIAANRHPKMYDLYQKHLNHWFGHGGDTWVAFANVRKPNKWGSWGVLENQMQPRKEAPKERAIYDYIRQQIPTKGDTR